MPRGAVGPSKLSGILTHLNKQPRLELSRELTALRVSYKYKNDDFGARYFVKESLSRIRYANPALQIQVDKLPPSANQGASSEPTLTLEFANSPSKTISLASKWSTTILSELMSTPGVTTPTSSWTRWVDERKALGESIEQALGGGKELYVKKPVVVQAPSRVKVTSPREVEPVENKKEAGQERMEALEALIGLSKSTHATLEASKAT